MLSFVGARQVLLAMLLFAALWSAPAFCESLDPTPVGGKWMRTDEIDPPTGNRVVVFTLAADEAELGRSPAFHFVCTGDGKLVHARYFADTPLRVTTGDYKHYDDPAMTPKIRINKKKTIEPVWDVLTGDKAAQIDKRTVQTLLSSAEIRIRFIDLNLNNFTDVFSPGGLNQNLLKRACGDNGWFAK